MHEVEEFKGHPVIKLSNEKFSFAFGLAKARLVVENIDAIRAFVEEHGRQ